MQNGMKNQKKCFFTGRIYIFSTIGVYFFLRIFENFSH